MATKIDSRLLNDTLNVVQLARQAALAKGNKERVSALETIAESLHQVAAASLAEEGTSAAQKSSASVSELKNRAFKSLLKTLQDDNKKSAPNALLGAESPILEGKSAERNHIIMAMADAGMSEVDIARQFGITRAEVHAIISLSTTHKGGKL